MKRLERLHALSEKLRRSGARGCTAERLAQDFGVSVRTIKRDIDALERGGAPVWAKPGPHGGYGITPQTALPQVSLTPAEAVALLTAVSVASEAPFADLASVAVQKILGVLDPRTRALADELASRVWVNQEPRGSRALRSALEEAMREQRVVRIRYTDKEGTTTSRRVEPLTFAARNDRWYLIAWCQLREETRWFLLSRIERATVTRAPCGGHTVAEIGTPPETARSVQQVR